MPWGGECEFGVFVTHRCTWEPYKLHGIISRARVCFKTLWNSFCNCFWVSKKADILARSCAYFPSFMLFSLSCSNFLAVYLAALSTISSLNWSSNTMCSGYTMCWHNDTMCSQYVALRITKKTVFSKEANLVIRSPNVNYVSQEAHLVNLSPNVNNIWSFGHQM